jgi:hypothetical protein
MHACACLTSTVHVMHDCFIHTYIQNACDKLTLLQLDGNDYIANIIIREGEIGSAG